MWAVEEFECHTKARLICNEHEFKKEFSLSWFTPGDVLSRKQRKGKLLFKFVLFSKKTGQTKIDSAFISK